MSTSQINPNQLRPSDDDGLGPIIQIGPERQAEAIGRLLATGQHPDREHARRFMDYARDHHIDLHGLWSRLDRFGRVTQSVLGVPSAGRTAMVFASRPAGRADLPSLAGVIDRVCQHMAVKDVQLAQVLLEPGELLEREAFEAAGFISLAILSYLERPIHLRGSRSPQVRWPEGITTVAYTDAMRDELLDVLDRSYEQTLDCPGLRGHRMTSDILDGHRATGFFDPQLWTILRQGSESIGALLMNPSTDHRSIELVYLGLVKSARGRGLGRRLLRFGLQRVEQRREQTINLAVDEANAPAVNLYIDEGFKLALRRRALIRPLQQGSA